MSRNSIIDKILDYRNDNNIEFNELVTLLKQLNFASRIKGDHFIFHRQDINEIINVQPNKNKAKAYHVSSEASE